MKVTRSIKLHFSKWLTIEKYEQLRALRSTILDAVELLLPTMEIAVLNGKSCFDCIKKDAITVPTPMLTARLRQNVLQNMYAIISGTLESAKARRKAYKTPTITANTVFLSSTIAKINTCPNLVDFDLLIELHSIGLPKLAIPLKRNRVLAAYLAMPNAKLCSTVTLGHDHIQLTVEFEVEKRRQSVAVGVDPGATSLLTLSSGEHLGTGIGALLPKLKRKKKHSKAWYRCKQEIKALIGVTIKQLPWETFDTLVLESNKGIKHKSKQRGRLCHNIRSFLDGWTVGELDKRVEYATQINGVSLRRVPAFFNSQHCPSCGCIEKQNRASQSVFKCVECGHTAHADEVGALNALARYCLGKYGSECKTGFIDHYPAYVAGNGFLYN